jgi:hypothetical protein
VIGHPNASSFTRTASIRQLADARRAFCARRTRRCATMRERCGFGL